MSSFTVHWDNELMNSMMFLYKSRRCPRHKHDGQCPYGKMCFDSHDEVTRRRPKQQQNRGRSSWNYTTTKCLVGYPNCPENCPKRNRCTSFHSSNELRYHPTQYKCASSGSCSDPTFKSKGICARGPVCWQFHPGCSDKRNLSNWIPRSIADTKLSTRSPPPAIYINWLNSEIQRKQSSSTPPPIQSSQPRSPPNQLQSKQMPFDQNAIHHNYNRQNDKHHQQLHRNDNNQQQHRNGNKSHQQYSNDNNVSNDNRNQVKREPPPPREPSKANNLRSPQLQQEHNEWLQKMSTWFHVFKVNPCRQSSVCSKNNCMDYHSPKDKRRPSSLNTTDGFGACPEVFDYYGTGGFRTDLECPNGINCTFAHNQYEMYYHQRLYKVKPCPYYGLCKACPECPFVRDEKWFTVFHENPIRKVKGNIVFHENDDIDQRTCLDYCPFYHEAKERRYFDDPDIECKKTVLQQPPHATQFKEEQQPMPAYGPQRPPHQREQRRDRTPPHYGRNKQNEVQNMNNNNNMNSNNNNNNVASVGGGVNKGWSKTDLDQIQSENTEWQAEDDW